MGGVVGGDEGGEVVGVRVVAVGGEGLARVGVEEGVGGEDFGAAGAFDGEGGRGGGGGGGGGDEAFEIGDGGEDGVGVGHAEGLKG